MRLIDLKQKEVINICSCSSLGCPADVDFNCITGRIIALIVPGPATICGILGREKDIINPWEAICQIGAVGHGDDDKHSKRNIPNSKIPVGI